MSASSNPIEPLGVRRALCGPTKVFKGHIGWVNSVAYFPDGRRIATASNDKAVIIWDVEHGRQDGKPLQHDFRVGELAISPDGRRIASGTEGGLVVWDVLTREVVHEIEGDGFWRLAYSQDGRQIATAPILSNEREIRLWDADTGRPGREPLKCHGEVMRVAFSPNGSQIVAGLEDGYFQVFDVLTGEVVIGPIKGHTDNVSSVVYSPDGHLVTASWDSSIRVWDSKTGVQVGKPMGHEDGVECISISADGRRMASGGWDGTVRLWSLETQLQVGDSLKFDADFWVLSVAISPDDRYVISGGTDVDGAVWLWDTEPLAIQGSSPPPTASNQPPPVPITQPIPPQALRQRREACAKSHNDASSTNSSLLDLPAVVQQQPATQLPHVRKPSVDDEWDTEPTRPHPRPTHPQQDPSPEQETWTVRPAATGRKWSHNIRECWRHIRYRKSRVPEDILDGPLHLSLPPDERANARATLELPTNQQAPHERAADAHKNAQGSHSATRPSRNQNEANVAFGKVDERLFAAAPRGRKGRRFRARAQRGGARANSHSDTESEDSDAESEYIDTGCLDAVCFGEYFRRRRYLQGR